MKGGGWVLAERCEGLEGWKALALGGCYFSDVTLLYVFG